MVFPRFCGRFIVTIPSNKTGGFAKTPVRLWHQQRFCGLAPARGLLLATRKRVRVFFQSVGPEVRFLWADSEYTPLSFSCSSQLYPHNIPGTRNFGSRICISNFRVSRGWERRSFLWENPWIPPHFLSAGFLPAYECSPSTIWIPFQLHNSPRIFPFSALCSPQNIFRRYFGANLIWYLQFHVVRAKLLLSFVIECPPFGIPARLSGRAFILLKWVFIPTSSALPFFWTTRLASAFLHTIKTAYHLIRRFLDVRN